MEQAQVPWVGTMSLRTESLHCSMPSYRQLLERYGLWRCCAPIARRIPKAQRPPHLRGTAFQR